MFYQVLRAELLKGRRSPVWLAFVVMPLIPAVLGTVNYWANLGLLQSEWYSLWTQHTLFSSFFFMPALLAVYCAWLWRLETVGHNMNTFMTQPVPVWMLYLAKLVMASGAAVLVQGVTVLLFVLSGWMMGLSSPPFRDILSWAGCGALGAVVVCAVQLWLSLVVKSFAPPVAMALMGGIAGLMAIALAKVLRFNNIHYNRLLQIHLNKASLRLHDACLTFSLILARDRFSASGDAIIG